MSGKLPKYRKHQSGRARVTINGRDHYLGPYGTKASHREYDRVIAEYLASGRSRSYGTEGECYTVAMLLVDYLKHARSYYGVGDSSEFHRIKRAVRPLKHLYAKESADEFGPNCFKACRQQLLDDGLSRSGINAHMKRVARMFKWAGAEGKLPASVYQTLQLIDSLKAGRTDAYETDPVLPVPQETVEATLPSLSPIVADMVRVQLLIGYRPAEVCRLAPGCIESKKEAKRERKQKGTGSKKGQGAKRDREQKGTGSKKGQGAKRDREQKGTGSKDREQKGTGSKKGQGAKRSKKGQA